MDTKPWQVLPEKFLERIEQIVPEDKKQSVLQSFCQPKPVTFRANTLKISTTQLEKELYNRKIPVERISFYPDAFILSPRVEKALLTESDLLKDGKIYIQSLSSMLPAIILDPKPDEFVCDLCAAPGSKTTQMAMMMQNKGTIFANDRSRARMFKLQANLKSQGVTNTRIYTLPGQMLWKKFPELFDNVLVDVPCTMEGRFDCNDPDSYKDWTPKKVKILSQMQQYLLRSAISMTKPGGTIVYSTCTLEPEENEAVIDWVLKKEAGKVAVESITLPFAEMMPGLTQWQKKTFDPSLQNTIRLLPSDTMEGFYVAKLKKI